MRPPRRRLPTRPRRFSSLAGWIALGYYSLTVTVLLVEYLSENDKLSRGMYTDTFPPLVFVELLAWPSSMFVVEWKGYPYPFDRPVWQKALNDSVPSHLAAVVVQGILLFLLIQAVSAIAAGLRRSARQRQPPPADR